jgi:hypothetical protein
MALEPVPWFVGGEAEHSASVARMVAWAATSGARGIILPTDMQVKALPVPGTAVQVWPGGAVMPNDYPGGNRESYMVNNESASDVPIAATSSSGPAVKYVIIRIDDPEFDGPTPADPVNGPYTRFAVVTSISNLEYPHVVLARINQPASTGTITQAMITDLRKVANPRKEPAMFTHNMTGGQDDLLDATSAYPAGGETWPEATETAWGTIDIPTWATRMKVKMTWAGVRFPGGDAWGYTWIQVAATANPNHFVTQATTWDSTGVGGVHRQVLIAADDKAIPAALRGTSQKIYPRANVNGGAAGARPKLDATSAIILEVEFYEAAAF